LFHILLVELTSMIAMQISAGYEHSSVGVAGEASERTRDDYVNIVLTK